ncbi:STAS domain-containing protein [Halalkalibacter akibai]|uniref:Positive regulator of sigma-B n=1 Tax=Halalkalibacter akibai (strain ATCC 43226 / DSM 21942 / CIP 109018 / JCM 9157 / 1139) TaxID=1236973 RepID=W4R008_HALA3|nr:STAS domain-containing protein [Halalkalibacter akibai]GAE36899.1 positive regulator of sigma-B [Halalkalibacter akibai JCM 9157]
MQPYIVSLLTNQRSKLMELWKKELDIVRQENYLHSVSDSVYENTNQEFMHFIIGIIDMDEKDAKVKLSSFAEDYIQSGWPLAYFTQGLQAFRRVNLALLSEGETDVENVLSNFTELENWIDRIINQLVYDYTGSWEDIFEMQKLSLLELSAPLIPVFEDVSVMPLIGTIDTARAKLIMENLLQGVIEHRSQVVLIDITGVPVVDTMVAHHIIQASEAVRLVGAKCILVGIRPEIAQTIVNLGIDLSKFPTKSTLRKGIETALELTNKKMVDL